MPTLVKAKKIRNQQINRPKRQKVYQSAKWKRLRVSKLQLNPLCEICLKEGRITPAEEVHHIISPFQCEPVYKDYYAYDFDNLLSICKQCHSKIHSNHNEQQYYQIYYDRKDNRD